MDHLVTYAHTLLRPSEVGLRGLRRTGLSVKARIKPFVP